MTKSDASKDAKYLAAVGELRAYLDSNSEFAKANVRKYTTKEDGSLDTIKLAEQLKMIAESDAEGLAEIFSGRVFIGDNY